MSNEVLVVFQQDATLASGSVLAISGFSGSLLDSTSGLFLDFVYPPGVFSGVARWFQHDGLLLLNVTSNINANATSFVAFTLLNPNTTQAARHVEFPSIFLKYLLLLAYLVLLDQKLKHKTPPQKYFSWMRRGPFRSDRLHP